MVQAILTDFREELLVALLSPEEGDEENARTVKGKQSTL